MREIKTIDALFAKKFTEETPYEKTERKKIRISRLKMNNIEELFIPGQPISLLLNDTDLL
jgi:hypothetical protein